MANLSRALVAVSGTLGQLANNSLEREHEKAMAMRQENFMRLQAMLGEESRAKERASDSIERQLDRTARKEEMTTELGARKEESAADRALRLKEGEADRALRRSEGAADRAVQMAQITDRQGKDYDARYLGQLDKIDKRIQEINDYKTQGVAEGKFVDQNAAASYDTELAQLIEQRRTLAQERDITLARGGDSRYRKLSAEEVAQLKKQGQLPTGSPTGSPSDASMPMAAQGPREGSGGSSIKVPQPPAKPPGMVAREERKRPPERVTGSQDDLSLGNWENATSPPPAPQQPRPGMVAGEGARDLVQLGRTIVGSRDRRNAEFEGRKAAHTAAQLLAAGRQPNAEIISRMAAVDRQTLMNDFGLTEQDLKKLGL
jgi:hypothetical protein